MPDPNTEEKKPTNPMIHRHIVATLRQTFGKQYLSLEKELETAPIEVLNDFSRLMRDVESELHNAKQRAMRNAMMGRVR
jgi:hypothetical protein